MAILFGKHDVKDDEIECFRRRKVKTRGTIFRRNDVKALTLQPISQSNDQALFVFD
jgi:hypothetical protein